jgi:hypothetical protein
MLPPSRIRQLDISRIPQEIFAIDGTRVSLREGYRDFIVDFFKAMKALSDEDEPEKELSVPDDAVTKKEGDTAQQKNPPDAG